LQIFTVWMEILANVPGSVLWLFSRVAEAEANLRREAQAVRN
jgi:predicted O-linked N-acetylglucosamine transferase (SPINDLY family)